MFAEPERRRLQADLKRDMIVMGYPQRTDLRQDNLRRLGSNDEK